MAKRSTSYGRHVHSLSVVTLPDTLNTSLRCRLSRPVGVLDRPGLLEPVYRHTLTAPRRVRINCNTGV